MLESFHSLCSCLTSVHPAKEFIVKYNDTLFRRLPKEPATAEHAKIQSIADIVVSGEIALKELIQDTSFGLARKVHLFKELAESFTRYQQIVEHSEGSNDLKKIIATSQVVADLLAEKIATIGLYFHPRREDFSILNTYAPDQPLENQPFYITFFQSILDSCAADIPEGCGISSESAILWLLQYLQAFEKYFPAESNFKAKINSAVADLKEMYCITVMANDLYIPRNEDTEPLKRHLSEIVSKKIEALKLIHPEFEFPDTFMNSEMDIETYLFERIFSRIDALQSTGDEYAIYGGYANFADDDAHAVIFRFQLEPAGTYRLRCIDTGSEGLDVLKLYTGGLDRDPEERERFMTPRLRRIRREVGWSGIPREAITPELLLLLIDPYFILDEDRDFEMFTVHLKLFEQLKKYPTALPIKGQLHKEQMEGSCATKCLTRWLHERLGNALTRKFKAFYTKLELNKLPKIKKYISDPRIANLLEAKAKYILSKRTAKALSTHLTEVLGAMI